VLSRFRNALREQGLATLGFRALASLAAWMTAGRLRVVWYLLIAQPVRHDWRIPAKMARAVASRVLRADDPVLAQAPRPAAVIADRFAQGAICIAAMRAEALSGFLWLCPVQYVEDDVRCIFVLPDSGVAWWDFDVWIPPGERNGVVFAKLWQAAHDFLRASGARWTCSRITRMNAASLGAHQRLGAVTIGHALFLCGRRRQVTIASHAFLHFSHGADAAPRLHVHPPYTPATPTDATPTTTRALP
jgi:hypothetical protein